ncbi:uncharacterized protein LOC117618404 [Prunus dulcis]|uniref:uncharacterized protein LOC117618404 n=1 Tax=Prunus dulcis TaxID=3755 RepID=UPI0014828DE4|nr:uncharacterized protein LOC117618404 [Prunus dulcis]
MAQKSKPKPKPNYDRKAKHPDYVQFRCNAYAFNSIIRDIKDKLNERQKKLLKKTPFWNLIKLFYHQRIDMNNMNKSDLDLVQLLKTFDPDTKSFKFGTKSFQITGNAVTQILGLPNEGKSVKLVNDRYTSTFRTRHFGEKGKPSKNQFLLCERTNIIQPILGKEKETPAILKWSLVELHTRFNQIKDLNDIECIFKTPKKRKTTREEEDTVEKGILKTYKKRKTTGEEGDPLDKEKEKEDDEGQQGEAEEAENQGKPDDADQTPELKEAGKKKMFENEAGKEPLAIQDLLVKSMTDQINYRKQQDPSFVCPERLQLWKDEKNEDSEKKMKELWDIFIQAEKRSKELEVELATYMEKLDNEECVTAIMTVESTIQLNEIQNLKRRIAELEGKETRIDMEKIAKKKEIQGKYKVTQEASQPDATNPIPDPPKGTSLHDSIPIGLEQSSDEDEGQKKPTKKKLGWGQRKVWQKIPKADRERIEKHYLSTQPRDIFWAGLNSEKVTNHDLKDIVWDLELSQNVIEAYIQIEEDKIDPMQTGSPQYMSTWTWAYMQSFQEPFWHRALYEHLLEKLGKCSVLFFPIISKEEFHFTLLTFHKNERKWRHYNPLRSLGHRKEERCIDIARNFVNIVEGWLEYIRPQARVFIETKKKPTIVKQKEGPPTLVQKDLTPTEELTLNWIMQNPLQFPFEDDMECAQQTVSSLDCGMFVMFYMDKIAQGQPIPKSVDKKFMNEYRAQYVTKLLHHKNCVINRL